MVSSGRPVLAVAAGDRAAQHPAHGAVDVAHPELEPHRVTALQGGRGQLDQPLVEDVLEVVLLRAGVMGLLGRGRLAMEQRRRGRGGAPSSARRSRGLEQVAASHQLLEAAEPERRHPLAHVLGHEEHEGDRRARGCPRTSARSSGSWVAMPTGQVLRWQTRIITQPEAISGAVLKPNSSAPSMAATTTSRPVLSWPSTWSTTRLRRPWATITCWVSASPSSQGTPACLSEESGEAPVPPS